MSYEQEFMLDFRLKAYRKWLKIPEIRGFWTAFWLMSYPLDDFTEAMMKIDWGCVWQFNEYLSKFVLN